MPRNRHKKRSGRTDDALYTYEDPYYNQHYADPSSNPCYQDEAHPSYGEQAYASLPHQANFYPQDHPGQHNYFGLPLYCEQEQAYSDQTYSQPTYQYDLPVENPHVISPGLQETRFEQGHNNHAEVLTHDLSAYKYQEAANEVESQSVVHEPLPEVGCELPGQYESDVHDPAAKFQEVINNESQKNKKTHSEHVPEKKQGTKSKKKKQKKKENQETQQKKMH